ncbi:MAG: glycerol kinase [Chloroflexi bacterium CFX4]|nr:glycerol kinase [Chloroflexi bacterium CFX4]MDL1923194.1 glycerol kinase GlpK [Chloroflexi bacterium CFX3]
MYILALDQGTTSSRAIVFDHSGKIVGVAQKEYPQIYPQPGWVEHNPADIWSTQLGVAGEALARANISPRDVAGIGITNQRETTIIWERATGKPIHNAIVWQCRRTAAHCAQLRAEGFAETVRAKTGLVLDPYFSGTKVAWLLDNVPNARQRAANGELAFGTVDTWLLWNLSGGKIHATDVSNASRTLLYNIHSQTWDDELLARLNIPRALLPNVLPSSAHYGETDAHIFGAAVPIGGVAGDQQAATFGQACYKVGSVKNTYGTGCFMLMNTGDRAVDSHGGLLTTIGWRLGDQPTVYALEGSVFVAGAAVQWLRDEMQLIRSAAESESVAASVPDSGGVYVVPAFAGLGAPYWDSFARGTIVGLTRGSNRAHIVRATLEAIAFQTRDVVEVMIRDAGLQLETLRVDGGAVANDWLMQFQADILGVSVVRPAVTETTALGAAYLAGLAVKFWESSEQIAAQWSAEKTFTPRMSADERNAHYSGWQRAVERAKAWISA